MLKFTDDTDSSKNGDSPAEKSSSPTPVEAVVSSTTKSTEFDNKLDKKTNEQQGNCYCGKERNLNIVELLCANCTRWYHESCIGYQLGKLVPFLSNYIFLCKNCSPTGLENFKKTQAQITQMCITALANLQQTSFKDGVNRTMFSKDREVIPYIEHHWEALTTTSRRVTQSWHATVHKALIKDIHILFVFEDHPIEGHMYGLISYDLTQIKPNYEAMIKGGILKITDMGIQHAIDVVEKTKVVLEYRQGVSVEVIEKTKVLFSK